MTRSSPMQLLLSLALVCGAGRALARQIGDAAPAGQVRLIASEDIERRDDGRYRVGWIKVSTGAPASRWQTLAVYMDTPATTWVDFGYELQDINFDGHPDLVVFEHGGAAWGRFHWWLYDPATRRFRRTALTAALRQLRFTDYRLDPARRQLIVTRVHGTEAGVDHYVIDGGRLRRLQSIRAAR